MNFKVSFISGLFLAIFLELFYSFQTGLFAALFVMALVVATSLFLTKYYYKSGFKSHIILNSIFSFLIIEFSLLLSLFTGSLSLSIHNVIVPTLVFAVGSVVFAVIISSISLIKFRSFFAY